MRGVWEHFLFALFFSPPFCLNNFFKSAECTVVRWMFFQAWVPSSPSSGLALSCCSLWRNGIILASLRGESVWAVTHTRGNPWRMIKSILQLGRQPLGALSLTPYWLLFSRRADETEQNLLCSPATLHVTEEGWGSWGMKERGRSAGRTSSERRAPHGVVQHLGRRHPFG